MAPVTHASHANTDDGDFNELDDAVWHLAWVKIPHAAHRRQSLGLVGSDEPLELFATDVDSQPNPVLRHRGGASPQTAHLATFLSCGCSSSYSEKVFSYVLSRSVPMSVYVWPS